MPKKSEFGRGFVYNLFLFAKHCEKLREFVMNWEKMRKESPELFSEASAVSLWFNGAGDHFWELEVPPQWKKHKIGKLARKLQRQALAWRMNELGNVTDAGKFFEELEDLCRLIDKELGVKPVKAQWN